MILIITLGPYTLPNYPLSKLLDQTKKIHEEIGEGPAGNTQIMTILGNKAASESFYKNRDDLEAFGLIEIRTRGRRLEIQITPLAWRAIKGDTAERRRAIEDVFDRFELWKKLRERFTDHNELSGFAQVLEAVTEEKPPDDKTCERIEKRFHDDLQFLNGQLSGGPITQINESRKVSIVMPTKKPSSDVLESAMQKTVVGTITYFESGVSIQIKDELSFEIAQMLLEAMRKQLGIAKKPMQTSLQDTDM
jgi:hypothetical protein